MKVVRKEAKRSMKKKEKTNKIWINQNEEEQKEKMSKSNREDMKIFWRMK